MKTYQDCLDELEYVNSVTTFDPGLQFRNDPKVFAEYCNMQANSVERAGFPLISADIRQRRDIADPHFRSRVRALGWTIEGDKASPPSA